MVVSSINTSDVAMYNSETVMSDPLNLVSMCSMLGIMSLLGIQGPQLGWSTSSSERAKKT